MLKTRATAPGRSLLGDGRHEGVGDITADATGDYINELRAGKVDPVPAAKKTAKKAATVPTSEKPLAAVTPPPVERKPPTAPVDPRIASLLAGENREGFLSLVDWYTDIVSSKGHQIAVETTLGDVLFDVLDWYEGDGFIKLVVRADRMPFMPKAMVDMRLRKGRQTYDVTCFAPLVPLLGELPYAEMLLIHDNQPSNTVEKNARITPGQTPSAVSGQPSTHVDNDEPVAGHEKAASMREPLTKRPADFDVPREDEVG